MTSPLGGLEVSLFLNSVMVLATPLILAALGETISERAGVLNIGVEGYMLMAAFASYAITYYTNNLWSGVLGGILGAMLISILHAYLGVFLGTDQVVSGIGINVFVLGITSLWYRIIIGTRTTPAIPPLEIIEIPLLSQIPIIGSMLFKHNVLVYLTYGLIPLCWFFLFRTALGLKVRAVGENPLAAEAMGVRVHYVHFFCTIICGALAGLGGSFLTLGYLQLFFDNVTAGRGFIALALVIVGGWDPIKVSLMSLVFGGINALQARFQAIFGTYRGIPYPFMLMLPYIITLVILFKAKNAPKALAVPYKRKK